MRWDILLKIFTAALIAQGIIIGYFELKYTSLVSTIENFGMQNYAPYLWAKWIKWTLALSGAVIFIAIESFLRITDVVKK